MPNEMARLIRERRQDLGLTQEQLAERIGGGARQSEVSRLEAGHVALPRRLRMEQISRALELPLGELLIRSGWAGADGIEDPAAGDRDRGDTVTGEEDSQVVQASVNELHELNQGLQASVNKLQLANDRLRDRGIEKETELRTAEAIVDQLRAILNALSDPVVVVNTSGFVVVENTAYAIFAARYTDSPTMYDAAGAVIPPKDLPLERAAQGEQFTMDIHIENAEERMAYKVEGQPASTVHGGLVGVVSFRARNAASA